MRKLLYNTIKEALSVIGDGSVIRHIDRWNNQLLLAEEEQPFLTPAIFIEFGPIVWRGLTNGVREAEVEIVLHIVTDSRGGRWSDSIEVFELLDEVHAALHGLHAIEDKRTMDSLVHIQSITDSDFDELEDNRETYSCHVRDASAYPYRRLQNKGIDFDVQTKLQHPSGI